jgi:hypothetical protein
MCDDAKGEGIVSLSVERLKVLNREHSSWWNICPEHGVALRECKCNPDAFME